MRGHVEVVKTILLYEPSCLDKQFQHNETPLMWSSTAGHVDLVEMLLNWETVGCAQNSRLHVVDSFGESPLHKAAKAGRIRVVEYLLKQGARIELFNKVVHLD